MKTLKASEILKECGLYDTVKRTIAVNPEGRYYAFLVDGQPILIESTASQLMDRVTQLAVEEQGQLFASLVTELTAPGTSIMLEDDTEKVVGRKVYIMRQIAPPGQLKFLITR